MAIKTSAVASEEMYPDTPDGNAKRWFMELKASEDELKDWHSEGETVLDAFRDVRDTQATTKKKRKLNVYTSNEQTIRAILYGNTPSVSVTRRFADANDDVGRVAGEMIERVLNEDLQSSLDSEAAALGHALDDRRLPGLGVVRVAYEAGETVEEPGTDAILDEEGNEKAPAVEPVERRPDECVELRWVHWKDVRWSPARVWGEVRWIAFRNLMTRKKLRERFGESLGKLVDSVPLNAKKGRPKDLGNDSERASPWDRAEVWEIWSKDDKKVYWAVQGFNRTLDEKEDPLELENFFPCPRFMTANVTTSSLVPKSDYALNKDLYEELHELQTRIYELVDALRVAGVYDGDTPEIAQLLQMGGRNKLIAVKRWAMFAEKGGLKQSVDWFPIEQVANVLMQLRDYRREHIDLIQQTTGMSDIMRGQATQAGATLGEQQMKVHFGSVRMQQQQDELARFASDGQSLKAEVMAKHFDPQTLIDRSNILRTEDSKFAQEAAELIHSGELRYRVEVKPEAISLTDFAALKQERLEVAEGLSNYMQGVAPIAQAMPGAQVPLLKILQWIVSGLRGASTIEGVIDQAVTAAEQAQQQQALNPQAQQPDPKLQELQLKAQLDRQKTQADLQAKLVEKQAEVQAQGQMQEQQMQWNLREQQGRNMLKAQELAMNPPKPGGAA